MEELFETLGQAGIQRSSLYLAWDFTVASERNLRERVLEDPRRRFRPARRHDLATSRSRGTPRRSRSIRWRHPIRPLRQRWLPERGGRPGSHESVTGTRHGPLLPEPPGCPPGSRLQFNYGPDGLPDTAPGQSPTVRRLPMLDSPSALERAERESGAAVALRPRPAGRGPARSIGRQHLVDGERAQLRLLRDRLVRASRPPNLPHGPAHPPGPLAVPARSRIGSSRASSTSALPRAGC